jgi:hypothetical protein
MTKPVKVIIALVVCLVLAALIFFGLLGYVPGLSALLGANKPRDLGVTYTEADFTAARGKSQLEYVELPANTPAAESVQRSGSRAVTTSWTSAEATSLMNDRPWRYWPLKDTQLKINDDGTAELAGIVVREKLKGYAAAIGVPQAVTDKIGGLLPANAAFYVKAKTSLTENKVSDFDVQSVYLGKIAIPVETLLSFRPSFVERAIAQGITGELAKYSGKKAAIVDFINSRLSKITGFYAKRAYFSDSQLHYDGTLSEKESTVH